MKIGACSTLLVVAAALAPPCRAEPRLLPHVERICDGTPRVGHVVACAEAGHARSQRRLLLERRRAILLLAGPADGLAATAEARVAGAPDPTIACANAIVWALGDRRPTHDVLGRFAFRTWAKERIAAGRIDGCPSGLDEAQRDLSATLAWQMLHESPLAPLAPRD
jgi:hypothetical protein